MKRFFHLFLQDFLIAFRGGHIAVIGIMLLAMGLLVTFIPKELEGGHMEAILDASQSRNFLAYMHTRGIDKSQIVETREELQLFLEKNPSKIGIIFTGNINEPRFQFIAGDAIPVKNLNLLQASMEQLILEWRAETGDITAQRSGETGLVKGADFSLKVLRPNTGEIPLNLKGVPLFIALEVALLGYLLIAVFIFQEKQEGTIRAFRVSPGGTFTYILSKTVLFMFLGLVYGGILVLFAFGLNVQYFQLMTILAVSSGLMTLVGICVAVFFRNLSQWFFPGLGVLILLSLPMISYIYPAFTPRAVKILPTYQMIFGIREALFSTGNMSIFRESIVTLSLEAGAALLLAYLLVRRKLMKEAN